MKVLITSFIVAIVFSTQHCATNAGQPPPRPPVNISQYPVVKEFSGVYDDPNLVGFYLYYDSGNPNAHDILWYESFPSVNNSHFDSRKKTKFLIHGFTQNGASSFPTNVKNSYLEHMPNIFNIIAVDWGKLSSNNNMFPVFYELAVENVGKVGQRVGEFIVFLKENSFTTEAMVHIIGFSLGAHVASYAGDYVHKTTGTKIGRITGLDPAGPGFIGPSALVKRLDKEDATFVDVIHTNAGGLGYPAAMGHVDFHPNGGAYQSSCGTPKMSINILDYVTGLLSGSCSHGKAPVYFAMSIDSNQIPELMSCKCSNMLMYELYCGRLCLVKGVLGERVPLSARGDYYLAVKPLPESAFEYSVDGKSKYN